jgi:RNA polymerase sigma factor (sigma-70 family)
MRKARREANEGRDAVPPYTRQATPGQLNDALYSAEYRKLVKILVVMGATIEEAEDAAQRALEYIFKRSRTVQDPIDSLNAYLCRAAIRFFLKERQRNRERLPREIKGGHLSLPTFLDDELTAWEGEQWIECVLECLTPAQREVIRLVMDGASNQEIAEELGKSNATIRQHLHQARDRLKVHPEIASRAPRGHQPQNRSAGEVGSAAASAPRREDAQ